MQRLIILSFILSSLSLPVLACAQLPLAPVDAASAECLSCHQDSITVNEPLRVCHQGDCDHPIGSSYEALSSRNRGLVPSASLDPALRLSDGKMGCLTCHVPYAASGHETADQDPMLVIDNAGSAMCVACHRK